MTRHFVSEPCSACSSNQVWSKTRAVWECPQCDWDTVDRYRARLSVEAARRRMEET